MHAGLHLGFFSRGGKIAVFAYQGGKRYMLYITIYIVKFQGGANIQQEGGANDPPLPPPKRYPDIEILSMYYQKILAFVTHNVSNSIIPL